MWTCPQCGERLEDQFDSCWKCAGARQPRAPISDLPWLYPLISLASCIGLGSSINLFYHSPQHAAGYFGPGGALFGLIVSAISIWAFFCCPWRNWMAKSLTLLFLVLALFFGVAAVGSFIIHALGYDSL